MLRRSATLLLLAIASPAVADPRQFSTLYGTCECNDLDPCFGALDSYQLTDVDCDIAPYLAEVIPMEGIPEPFYGKAWAVRERGAAGTPTVTISTFRRGYANCPQYMTVQDDNSIEVDLPSAIVFVEEDVQSILSARPWNVADFGMKLFFSILRGYRFEVMEDTDGSKFLRIWPSYKGSVPGFIGRIIDKVWGEQDLKYIDGQYVRTENGEPFYYVDEIYNVSQAEASVAPTSTSDNYLSLCGQGHFGQLVMARGTGSFDPP